MGKIPCFVGKDEDQKEEPYHLRQGFVTVSQVGFLEVSTKTCATVPGKSWDSSPLGFLWLNALAMFREPGAEPLSLDNPQRI